MKKPIRRYRLALLLSLLALAGVSISAQRIWEIVPFGLKAKLQSIQRAAAPSASPVQSGTAQNPTDSTASTATAPALEPAQDRFGFPSDLRVSVLPGGGDTSTDGRFNTTGAIGQAVLGSASDGGRFNVIGGFWVAGFQCSPINLNPATLPTGLPTASYNQTLTQTGGSGALTWSLSAGALPNGISLSAGGTLAGTPTQLGTFNFTVKVTDANGCMGTRAYTLAINCQPISLNAPPNGTVGTAYNFQFVANDSLGATSFSLFAGSLPPGLTLAASGSLLGVPTQAGNFQATVKVTDQNSCMGSSSFTLSINPPACGTITLSPATLPPGTVGSGYSQTFSATGGNPSYTFSVTAGGLPSGLSLSAGGALTGAPSASGTFNFTVTATDALNCVGSRAYTLTINCQPLSVANPATSTGTLGAAFSQTFTQTGGIGTITFSTASTLPTGLSLSAGGVLSGTPTQTGSFPIAVKATDANGCMGTSASYTLTISCATITLNPASLPAATQGTAYNQALTSSGGAAPYTFSLSAGAPPAGVTLTPAGNLAGTPTSTGAFNFTVRASDANNCSVERAYTLQVNPPTCGTITISPATLPAGTVGSGYSQTFSAAGGNPSYTFSVTTASLPSGLSLSGGVLSGTPTASGTFNFTVTVTDVMNCTGSRAYTLAINSVSIPTIASLIPASAAAGGAAFTLTVNGAGFTNGSVVLWNNSNRATSFVSAAQLMAAIPATDIVALGTANVTVSTPGSGTTSALPFTIFGAVASVSAASFLGQELAQESIIAAFGANLAASVALAETVPLPTTLAGTRVLVRDSSGVERLAPLFFVAPSQINYLVPTGTATGTATLLVTADNDNRSTGTLNVQPVAPGLFAANANGQGVPAANLFRVTANGQQIIENVAQFQGGTFVPLPIELGPAGEQVFLILYGTGFRGRSSQAAVTAQIGGTNVDVPFAGAQGNLVGLDQMNIGPLPRSLAGRGNVNVVITVDGKNANTMQINIK